MIMEDSPGSCVGVGIPRLLLYSQRSLRQDGTKPRRDVFPDMIDLVCVLPRASGSILVRPVFQNLHPTSLTTALLSALLLQEHRQTRRDSWKLMLSRLLIVFISSFIFLGL